MRNISFDNPYWLLLAVPLLLGVLIPFCIAIRRENRSKSTVASLVIHLLIVALVGLGVGGTVITTVMTKTEIYVVADVSYSANRNLDEVDGYIAKIKEELPKNTELGVVCFGADYVLHTPLGGEIAPVSSAEVDDTATDIASALQYTGTLFGEDTLKRVILITDGCETVSEDASRMISAIEGLAAADVAVDAIYLDSNIADGVTEAQVSGVDFTGMTYLNHETTADVLLQSNTDTRAIVSLYKNGEKLTDRATELSRGFNVLNFALPTELAGSFDYEVRVNVENDTSGHNNSYSFTQTVSADISVLLVTGKAADVGAAERLLGERARIDVMFLTKSRKELSALVAEYEGSEIVNISSDPFNVPCSVEELCGYDEIIISSTDIRDINNVSAFIGSVETVVSQYGKSLMTVGDIKIQNKTDETLESLESMLPVKFGNSAQDPKLYAIVIDTSRSMFTASRLAVAKQAAIHLLNILNDEDEVIVVAFAGDINIIQSSTKAVNRQDIAKKINDMQPTQGTSIAGGMKAALDMLVEYDNDVKEVMLISDGMNYTAEIVEIDGDKKNATQLAEYMAAKDISVSTMNPYNQDSIGVNTMTGIAAAGGGTYYYIKDEKSLEDIIFSDVADDLTESVINEPSLVEIAIPKDDVMSGIAYLPKIGGYVHSKAKVSATTPLTVGYTKPSGVSVQVPLYSYWKYGNGTVASFTSEISGAWADGWQGDMGQLFLWNMIDENIPEEKIDRPYSVNVGYDGIYADIEIIPAVLDPFATVDVTVTMPDGSLLTEQLSFDTSSYFLRFEVPSLGKYGISLSYNSEVGTFGSEESFNICYSPEYNAFASFDPSTLHAAIRHRGTVSEGEMPDISGDKRDVATYRLTFTVPFMIAAVVLYVLDIIIRKIKWRDIKGLFRRAATK